jgi:hypothetical protein
VKLKVESEADQFKIVDAGLVGENKAKRVGGCLQLKQLLMRNKTLVARDPKTLKAKIG